MNTTDSEVHHFLNPSPLCSGLFLVCSIKFPSPWWIRRGSSPALSRMLRAVGCQVMIPTLLEWPSSTTTGSAMGVTKPFSGICHTWKQQILLKCRDTWQWSKSNLFTFGKLKNVGGEKMKLHEKCCKIKLNKNIKKTNKMTKAHYYNVNKKMSTENIQINLNKYPIVYK